MREADTLGLVSYTAVSRRVYVGAREGMIYCDFRKFVLLSSLSHNKVNLDSGDQINVTERFKYFMVS